MGKLDYTEKMTRKYFEEMTDTNKQDTIDSSDSSSVEEPQSPIIKSYKPLNSPPHLILDPDFSEEEESSDDRGSSYSFGSSILAWPVKKLISKKPKFDDKKKVEKQSSGKSRPKKSFLSYFVKRK